MHDGLQKKKVTLLPKKRKEYLEAIEKEDQRKTKGRPKDVPEDTVRNPYRTLQFQHFPKHKAFIDLFISDEPQHLLLLDCVRGMQDIYKKLLH